MNSETSPNPRRDALRLPTAPRELPLFLGLKVAFGGTLSLIGWWVFGLSASFCTIFVTQSTLMDIARFSTPLEQARGRVTGQSQTSYSVNKRRIYRMSYTFTVKGQKYTGQSYKIGGSFPPGHKHKIEYDPNDPRVSRMVGLTSRPFGNVVAFVLLFPSVGLLMILVGTKQGLKSRRMLQLGELAWAKLKEKRPTNTRVNNRRVYEYVFEFEVFGDSYPCSVRTHEPDKILDEAEEPVLYNPQDPTQSIMYDTLPCKVVVDDYDGILEISPSSLFALVVPMLLGAAAAAYIVSVALA